MIYCRNAQRLQPQLSGNIIQCKIIRMMSIGWVLQLIKFRWIFSHQARITHNQKASQGKQLMESFFTWSTSRMLNISFKSGIANIKNYKDKEASSCKELDRQAYPGSTLWIFISPQRACHTPHAIPMLILCHATHAISNHTHATYLYLSTYPPPHHTHTTFIS